jgi:hypothetical protein
MRNLWIRYQQRINRPIKLSDPSGLDTLYDEVETVPAAKPLPPAEVLLGHKPNLQDVGILAAHGYFGDADWDLTRQERADARREAHNRQLEENLDALMRGAR